jgi:hypothetical protein
MKIRRVVTGHDDSGRAVVVSDGAAPRTHDFVHVPGMASTMLWATVADALGPSSEDPTPNASSQVPGPDGTCFVIVTFPPDSIVADPVLAGAEHRAASPGIAERFEADNPGMHTTPTVDYVIVLDGSIWLDLDDGAPVRLDAGDVVIQNATRHAWRNLSDAPVTIAAVQIGVAVLRGGATEGTECDSVPIRVTALSHSVPLDVTRPGFPGRRTHGGPRGERP